MSDDKMKTVRVLNQFNKYVIIEVSEELYSLLETKVKNFHCKSVETMQLMQECNITLDKLMLTAVTETMVNDAVNELISKEYGSKDE